MTENIGAALERAVSLYGDRVAVVDGETRWSYRELGRRTAALDMALDDMEIGAGEVVGVLAQNSAAHLICWLAIPRSGRILNDLNYRLAVSELEFILEDSGAKALIVDDEFLRLGRALVDRCSDVVAHLIYIGDQVVPDGCVGVSHAREAVRPLGEADPDLVAGIFYTGGTTGRPKGAMLTHRNLVHNAKHALICLGYDHHDIYLHSAPMFHLADGASTYALTWVGGRHVIQRAFEPGAWLALVAKEHVTRGLLVPTMINMVVNDPDIGKHDLTSLRGMLYGASPMPAEVLKMAMDRLPCDWGQAYGMTEAAPILTYLSPEDHRAGAGGDERLARRLGSAGRPIVGVEVEVRRADGVTMCEVDEPGELYARGPNIMQGYWNRPKETAEALIGGWYRTGDAGLRDADGYLYIVDRVKDMIISGGENVYCTEVENAIYQHPAVYECAVFGIPDERWGEQVHAAVVLRPGTSVDGEELADFCRPLIAGYKLPRSIAFLDALPRSGAGKILKKELRDPYWASRDRQVA